QDPAGSMPLVESKPTAVRVTVRHGLDGWGADIVPGVRGRIRVRTPGIGTSPWFDAANQGGPPMAPNPSATITVKANPTRNLTDDTLNFVVPPGWARGDQVRLDIEVRVLMFGASSGFPGYSEQVTGRAGPMRFERRRTLQLRYVEVSLNGAPGPGAATCTRVLTESVALLPTPTAGIAALPGGGAALNFSSGNGSDERRDLLEDWDDEHNCSTFESLFEWLGYDCPEDDGAIWVLIPSVQATGFFPGEAYDIPSNVCMTPPTDGTYAAHELAHCLNQEHVRTSCGTGAAPTGGVAPSAWPNNGILSDIPFDTVRNVALTLAGAQVGDVMTYCGTPNNTWPSPQRWLQLWAEIGS
ncbi:MAG: hypothetical protein JWP95_831, partial [Actinotalea sp.]|nr:hypothetical protein [Actinotalea sp.]